MRITFLGTGTSQGVPVVACQCDVCQHGSDKNKRLRSSLRIEKDKTVLVIDAGPDFRQQLLREKVTKLDAILITHHHKDHIGGLDDVRSFNWLTKKPMDIYASTYTQEVIMNDFFYAFEKNSYPGVPAINLHAIYDKPFNINNVLIQPLDALHMKLAVKGFRIGDFSYVTDANYLPAETLALLSGSKVIVLNALREQKHISHYNLEEAIEILEFLRPEKAYLTHISHLMGFHEKVSKNLPSFIELAYDGLTVEL